MEGIENGRLDSAPDHQEQVFVAAGQMKTLLPAEYADISIGIVCGSGLGGIARRMSATHEIPYEHVPHMPQATVVGHRSKFVVGLLNGVACMAMLGRFHYYEGRSLKEIAFPIRLMAALGIKSLLVTNAAGGLDRSFRVGDIMVIEDQICFPSLAGMNVLRGPNFDKFGPRFPAMTEPYRRDSFDLVRQAASDISAFVVDPALIRRGVYASDGGPSYETRAECRLLLSLGASAVGMSTAQEVIAAVHSGFKSIVGLSLITNLCVTDMARLADQPRHEEVLAVTDARMPLVEELIYNLIPLIRAA